MRKRIYTILDNYHGLLGGLPRLVLKFSKDVKEDYHHLTRIASNAGVPSLSAVQIGSEYRMFVVLN